MTVYDKKLKELSIILQQDNIFKIKAAIRSLRESPYFEGAIGLLVSLYDRSNDASLKKIITEFMNDLKGVSVCSEVVAELKKDWQPETITMLVSSCWQSGLDYSGHCSDFARIFLSADYVTAIECFSVLEASTGKLNRAKKNEIIEIMEKSNLSKGDEKYPLLNELLFLFR